MALPFGKEVFVVRARSLKLDIIFLPAFFLSPSLWSKEREIESGSAHEGGGYIVSRARKTEKVGATTDDKGTKLRPAEFFIMEKHVFGMKSIIY